MNSQTRRLMIAQACDPVALHEFSRTIEHRPRSYKVSYRRDFRPGWGLHWQLDCRGQGHWCVGGPEAGKFRTEAEAIAAGEAWVETGKAA